MRGTSTTGRCRGSWPRRSTPRRRSAGGGTGSDSSSAWRTPPSTPPRPTRPADAPGGSRPASHSSAGLRRHLNQAATPIVPINAATNKMGRAGSPPDDPLFAALARASLPVSSSSPAPSVGVLGVVVDWDWLAVLEDPSRRLPPPGGSWTCLRGTRPNRGRQPAPRWLPAVDGAGESPEHVVVVTASPDPPCPSSIHLRSSVAPRSLRSKPGRTLGRLHRRLGCFGGIRPGVLVAPAFDVRLSRGHRVLRRSHVGIGPCVGRGVALPVRPVVVEAVLRVEAALETVRADTR